mmetsp:Transcript_569/g.1169  ORF Transcript_569/g.1169 Transcript_569/m.1169 type:complete len:220 (-) Transcript_569:154-813(-)|eukprot:CAMPEP_0171353520 /NCGR_PEP_ID=MMETSP0878-20121228/44233_1 /TAXON_ID=67004 /ORGANISM="Thalassiosira weissflogii, Strain CCMP1336" /LENGTH=219 /DNA_ID=CAMNT_0011859465 /DNA_START=59 /DNA_END=718 /DNA_ORIENTATION=-
MMISHRSQAPLHLFLAFICNGHHLITLEAFAPSKLSSQKAKTAAQKEPSSLFESNNFSDHIFQDDDCEDLCSGFDDDFSDPRLSGSREKVTMPSSSTPSSSSLVSNDYDANALKEQPINSEYRSSKRLLQRNSYPPSSHWGQQPRQCNSCSGKGTQTCRFCGGTTFMAAIGGSTNALFTAGIGKDCPVCDEDGLEVCHQCAGTGWVVFLRGRNATNYML